MKKTLRIVALVLVLAMSVCVLASCGKKLSGEYVAGGDFAGTSYTFKGSKVTIKYTVLGFEKTIEGEYEITTNDDDKEVIIFTFGDDAEDADKYEGEFAFAEGKEGDTEYIKIGIAKYTKVKK
jgi:uncharacterized lipoprotein YehR (DUF1307 family)